MNILKEPEFENDDYLIRLDPAQIPTGTKAYDLLKKIDPSLAEYYAAKSRAFLLQDTTPNIFEAFVEDKPSLRCLSELDALDSTIYTVACERENSLSYKEVLKTVKQHLAMRPDTRRCVVRLVNSFDKYFSSETTRPADVTCLSLIHYLKTGPKLVFRASDVKNELLIDILTIHEFFIDPVYNSNFKNLQLSVYSSTTQGVSSWDNFVNLSKMVFSVEGET
jgi:hypothetical protein